MARFGYYADLRGLTFTESKSWIQAMRVGNYSHPSYGQISFTADRLRRFADSVKNKVRGIALDIDYDHKADPTKGNEAAGWVEDAKVEGDTLYLCVDWTATAKQKIQEKAYRYFSPEFQDEWTDSQGTLHRDVLFGGGLTNRPFLKDLLPVNLSELTFAETKNEGKGMDLAKLRKLYGLPEDGSQDDQILVRAQEDRTAATSKGGNPPDRTGTTHAPNNGAGDPQPKLDGKTYDATTAGAVNPDGTPRTPDVLELSELAKKDPIIKLLMEQATANNKRLAELEAANKLSEIKVKLNEYRTGDKVVAPAILDEASKLLVALPVTMHEKVHAMLAEVRKLGEAASVKLGETGYSHADQASTSSVKLAEDKVDAEAKKLFELNSKTNKDYSMADAYVDAMAENPQLFTEYQNAAYAFKA